MEFNCSLLNFSREKYFPNQHEQNKAKAKLIQPKLVQAYKKITSLGPLALF